MKLQGRARGLSYEQVLTSGQWTWSLDFHGIWAAPLLQRKGACVLSQHLDSCISQLQPVSWQHVPGLQEAECTPQQAPMHVSGHRPSQVPGRVSEEHCIIYLCFWNKLKQYSRFCVVFYLLQDGKVNCELMKSRRYPCFLLHILSQLCQMACHTLNVHQNSFFISL